MRLGGRGVVVNAVHPGLVANTGLLQETRGPFKWVTDTFGSTPEKGADTVLWLATAPEAATVSGKLFNKRGHQVRVRTPPRASASGRKARGSRLAAGGRGYRRRRHRPQRSHARRGVAVGRRIGAPQLEVESGRGWLDFRAAPCVRPRSARDPGEVIGSRSLVIILRRRHGVLAILAG